MDNLLAALFASLREERMRQADTLSSSHKRSSSRSSSTSASSSQSTGSSSSFYSCASSSSARTYSTSTSSVDPQDQIPRATPAPASTSTPHSDQTPTPPEPVKPKHKFPLQPAPLRSSNKRWTRDEAQYLIKLRKQHVGCTWDYIAMQLNAEFGMERNGNSVRSKYGKII
jgi:hypothetical protein